MEIELNFRQMFSENKKQMNHGYCKFPDFTLPKLGIIPDFVL